MGLVVIEAAQDSFALTLGSRGFNAPWWASGFDATLGFPGGGTPCPCPCVHAPPGLPTGRRLALEGLSRSPRAGGVRGPGYIPWGLSSNAIHDALLRIALRGNSARPNSLTQRSFQIQRPRQSG
jgi:hypothetical protein